MAIVARGDLPQAEALEPWRLQLLQAYGDRVLGLDSDAAQRWGRLRVPYPSRRSTSRLRRKHARAALSGMAYPPRLTRMWLEEIQAPLAS